MPELIDKLLDSKYQCEIRHKFQEILTLNGIHDEIECVEVTIPDDLKGQHMTTTCLHATIHCQNRNTHHWFLKTYSANPKRKEITKGVMDKEVAFLTKLIPEAVKFCQSCESEDVSQLTPKCLYGDSDFLVLENVREKGFKMLPMQGKQDLNAAKIVLQNLARFHATFYAMIQDSGGLEAFKNKWSLICSNVFIEEEVMFENGMQHCIDVLQVHPVPGSTEASTKLQEMKAKENICQEVKSLITPQDFDKLLLLNHGDCWNNNIMFKIDSEGKITEQIFIDFQIMSIGSPNLDLGFYLYSSVTPEVRREHAIPLLQHYYKELQAILQTFGQDVPISFQDFLTDYLKKSMMGFYFTLCTLPALQAWTEVGMDNSDEEQGTATDYNAIYSWIQTNREKVGKLSPQIVLLLEEPENLTKQVKQYFTELGH